MPVAETLRRYLERYAEPGSTQLAASVDHQQFQQVLVIPCFAEADDFLDQMNVPGGTDTLTIVVVNSPDNASAANHLRTRDLLAALRVQAVPNRLIIDRVSEPIPHRLGVGLARKIGADIAVALIAGGVVRTRWIYLSDADASLPADYFQTPLPTAGTILFGYRHKAAADKNPEATADIKKIAATADKNKEPATEQSELQRRADLYELHLRYYTWQLRSSGSSYGFSSLGSIISVSVDAYVAVRGVPKRNAAEDFYLLNKLAKVGPVTQLTRPVIQLAGRASTRVPFGTGPAMTAMPAHSEEYLSYAPATFDSLANTLTALTHCAAGGELMLTDNEARISLDTLGWARFEQQLRHTSAPRQRRRQIREWFDGFRTMRFVRLAAASYPDQPLLNSLRNLLSAAPDTSAETLLNRLIDDEKSVTILPDGI
jgi:hypothetical protein